MKELLKELGISEKTINSMIEICPNIEEMSLEELTGKIEILKKENCDKIQVVNIISSNAMFLDRSDREINSLISKLKECGFTDLDLLFDGNPYILNLSDFEIERYIQERIDKGEVLEDIVDDMSSNLFVFNEI